MEEILQGVKKAIELIINGDKEVIEIAIRSLGISLSSTLLASLICIPIGALVHFHNFFGKRFLITIFQTLFSVPTVCVGLFVFLLLSRKGPFGVFGLLFTPLGMIIAQTILISPLIISLTISALSGVGKEVKETALSLGASKFRAIITIIKEARFGIVSGVIMGFGRAISEVGVAMMIGGNIKGATRVFTTAIALETAKGEIELAIALGIILLLIAIIINLILNRVQQR